MMALFLEIIAAVAVCESGVPNPAEAALACTFNRVGMPIYKTRVLQTSTEAEVLAAVNGRVNIVACQVNPRSMTIANSVAQNTNEFTSLDDIISALRASDMVREKKEKGAGKKKETKKLTPFFSLSLSRHDNFKTKRATHQTQVPCFTEDAFYNTFRGSAYIDG